MHAEVTGIGEMSATAAAVPADARVVLQGPGGVGARRHPGRGSTGRHRAREPPGRGPLRVPPGGADRPVRRPPRAGARHGGAPFAPVGLLRRPPDPAHGRGAGPDGPAQGRHRGPRRHQPEPAGDGSGHGRLGGHPRHHRAQTGGEGAAGRLRQGLGLGRRARAPRPRHDPGERDGRPAAELPHDRRGPSGHQPVRPAAVPGRFRRRLHRGVVEERPGGRGRLGRGRPTVAR